MSAWGRETGIGKGTGAGNGMDPGAVGRGRKKETKKRKAFLLKKKVPKRASCIVHWACAVRNKGKTVEAELTSYLRNDLSHKKLKLNTYNTVQFNAECKFLRTQDKQGLETGKEKGVEKSMNTLPR